MEKYPFISCLRPIRVRNKATKEMKMVKCGHCSACLNHRSMRGVAMCELEQKGTFSTTYFITLTYNDENIPQYKIVPTDDDCMYMLQDLNPRSDTYCQLLEDQFFISDKQYNYITGKSRLRHGNFSYLYYKDIQNFMKMVRKDMKKKYNEEIRVYVTGEYGPKSLRAHWHLIIFARKKLPLLQGNRYIFARWKKGFVYSERTRNGAISYCSSYVNSGSALPPIYKDARISTKSYHSIRMGFEAVAEQISQKIDDIIHQKTDRREKIQIPYPIDGAIKQFPIDPNYQNTCIPKPYGFACIKSDRDNIRYVSAYDYYYSKFFNLGDLERITIRNLTDITLRYLCNVKVKRNDSFSAGFMELLDIDNLVSCDYDDISEHPYFSRLYAFMRFSCGISQGKYSIDRIIKYYDFVDYQALVSQYMLQEEYFREYGYSEDWKLFYFCENDHNFRNRLEKNNYYKWYANKHKQIHDNKLIRKKMNDDIGLVG